MVVDCEIARLRDSGSSPGSSSVFEAFFCEILDVTVSPGANYREVGVNLRIEVPQFVVPTLNRSTIFSSTKDPRRQSIQGK
jgi:hypothetical protein